MSNKENQSELGVEEPKDEMEQFKRVLATNIYAMLHDTECKDILTLFEDGQISIGKCIEAISEVSIGIKPRLLESAAGSEEPKCCLPPLGDRTHHLETDEVMAAIEGTDYLKSHVANKLYMMTSGERYSLYRAVVKLVDKRRAAPVASQAPERLVPRILNSKRDEVLDEVIEELLKYLGPKHAAVIAVQNLKQG